MKYLTQHLAKELAFVALLVIGIIAIAHAQDQDKQKRVKVQIEVTEGGKTTTTTQEIELNEENVQFEMDEMIEEIEMVLEEAVRDLEDSDLEIIINKRGTHQPDLFAPHYRQRMRSVREPRHPRAPRAPAEPRAHAYAYHYDVEEEPRAFLGVVTVAASESSDASEGAPGARITRVVEGSAAEEAGLREGDVLTEIDGVKVQGHNDLAEVIRSHDIGDAVIIKYHRDANKEKVKVELKEYKPSNIFEFEHNGEKRFRMGPRHRYPDKHWKARGQERRVFLGIEGKSLEEGGVALTEVYEETTAEKMGLKSGDKIISVNGEDIEDMGELIEVLHELNPGDMIDVIYLRDGSEINAQGEIGSLPSTFENELLFGFEGMDEMDDFEMFHDGDQRFVYRFEMEELDQDEIRELNKKSGVAMDENNSLSFDRFSISPNPSEGIFVVDAMMAKGEVNIIVLDSKGSRVLERSMVVEDDGLLTRLDLTDQEPGVYFVSIQQNGKGKVSRIVKQ